MCPLPTETGGLSGTYFMEEAGACATINYESSKLSLTDFVRETPAHSDAFEDRTAVTIVSKGEEGHKPQHRRQAACQKDEQVPVSRVVKRIPLRTERGL